MNTPDPVQQAREAFLYRAVAASIAMEASPEEALADVKQSVSVRGGRILTLLAETGEPEAFSGLQHALALPASAIAEAVMGLVADELGAEAKAERQAVAESSWAILTATSIAASMIEEGSVEKAIDLTRSPLTTDAAAATEAWRSAEAVYGLMCAAADDGVEFSSASALALGMWDCLLGILGDLGAPGVVVEGQ